MIRNVIFDWSGTLVDDLPAVWQATNYVLEQAGLPSLTLEQFRAEFCLPFQSFYNRFTPHVPADQVETWFHSRFQVVRHSIRELPHAREFLEFCQNRGLRLFVLSTVQESHYQHQAERCDFARFIEKPYLGIWDKRTKIRDLLQENQLDPGETLFIGDMVHDVETARHGGIASCAVLTGYTLPQDLRQSRPDLIVEHLGELRHLLERHNLTLPNPQLGPHPYPIPTVGALIQDEAGHCLMIRTHKWSNLWGIPGGKIKWGEPSPAALAREILEETGLVVDHPCLVMVQDCIRSEEFFREAHFLLLNYTCRVPGVKPDVRLNEEALESRWVTWDEAFALPLNQPTLLLLRKLAATPHPMSDATLHPLTRPA